MSKNLYVKRVVPKAVNAVALLDRRNKRILVERLRGAKKLGKKGKGQSPTGA